jgi:hypothetical protein
MKIQLENIYKISNDMNLFYIECKNTIIQVPIIEGTVKINIVDDDNINIGINGLEKNDYIKIYYKEKKKKVILIRIIKLNNYSFNNMSSSSDTEYILN